MRRWLGRFLRDLVRDPRVAFSAHVLVHNGPLWLLCGGCRASHRTSTCRRGMSVIGLIAGMLLVGTALAGCATDTPPPTEQPAAAPAPRVSLPEAQQALDAPIVPGYSVSIPKLGVSSSLVRLGLNPDRTVQVPALDQPAQLGVLQPPRGAPLPGATGPAAIFGHVNGRVNGKAIPGAFARLDTLIAGDHIDVAVPDGLAVRALRFTVTRVASVEKETFPTAEVYSDTPGPELRLITCGGEYDRAHRNFLSNVIVFAKLEQP